MKIVETYSHQNGLEYLIVHQPDLWNEVQQVIRDVDASACLTKVSKESCMMGQLKYSPKDMNKQFMNLLDKKGWHENRVSKHLAFYVQDEIDVGIEILAMKSLQQNMSSGPGYYEGEFYNVIRNGRGVPAVPLVMIGVAP